MNVDVDVLIVGGGVQGLWLLNDLTRADYSAVLVEREALGAGQTGHAHALIHRGHYYSDRRMMTLLNSAAQHWKSFIARTGVEPTNPYAYAGFGPGVGGQYHRSLWDAAGLTYSTAIIPDVFSGESIAELYRTEEFSLDSSSVVSALVRDVRHLVFLLDPIRQPLRFARTTKKITTVDAAINDTTVRFTPKYVFLCAGEGNLDLLRLLHADHDPVNPRMLVQARRKNHMLVLRGPHLPPMAAVFPIDGGLRGLFICSRPDPETRGNAWMVSDHNSTRYSPGSHHRGLNDPTPDPSWIRNILGTLSDVAPAALKDGELGTLWASVYTGLTSEREFGAGSHQTDCHLESFGLRNLSAIWPTKLTLAPLASNIGARLIYNAIPSPAGCWTPINAPLSGARPAIAPEMWTRQQVCGPTCHKTPWVPYREFLHGSDTISKRR